jgi:hypothetical protein
LRQHAQSGSKPFWLNAILMHIVTYAHRHQHACESGFGRMTAYGATLPSVRVSATDKNAPYLPFAKPSGLAQLDNHPRYFRNPKLCLGG